jgi:hypothetical protein
MSFPHNEGLADAASAIIAMAFMTMFLIACGGIEKSPGASTLPIGIDLPRAYYEQIVGIWNVACYPYEVSPLKSQSGRAEQHNKCEVTHRLDTGITVFLVSIDGSEIAEAGIW